MNTEEGRADLAREGDESLAEPSTKPELDLNQFLPYWLNIAQWRVLA